MPVGELSERVTYTELVHWIAYLDEEVERAKPPEKRRIRRLPSRKELIEKLGKLKAYVMHRSNKADRKK